MTWCTWFRMADISLARCCFVLSRVCIDRVVGPMCHGEAAIGWVAWSTLRADMIPVWRSTTERQARQPNFKPVQTAKQVGPGYFSDIHH